MSIRSIINFRDAIDLAIGVNIKLLADRGTEITYCIVKRERDQVSLIDRKDGIRDVNDLYSHLQPFIAKGVRVHVNCIGRNVLNKIVDGPSSDSASLLEQWLPGIRKDDFVVQRLGKKTFSALSLIRLEDIQNANLFLNNNITSFSVGVGVAETIASIVNQRSITLDGWRIEFDGHEIKSIESSHEDPTPSLEIGGIELAGSFILSYASAMSFYLPVDDLVIEGLPATIVDATTRYRAKQQIYQVGKWIIVALLVLLPINLILNLWLNETVPNLEAALQLQEGRKKTSQQNTNSAEKLNKTFQALGYSTNRLPLYYVDQVCVTLPPDIQLDELQAGILDENVLWKDRQYQFDVSQIRVQGVSNDPIAVNNWIQVLDSIAWVRGVKDQKYHFDPRLRKGVFEFIILISP